MSKKKIAAIITEYRPRSHADVIVSKFLKGFPTDEGLCAPRVEVASMYIDQFPENDMGRAMAQEHGVPIFNSISAALCLGGRELAVDGVLSIGEHGDYAWNEEGTTALSSPLLYGTNMRGDGDVAAGGAGVQRQALVL